LPNHSLKFKYLSQKDKARINRGEEDNESELQAKCLSAMNDNDTVRKDGKPPENLCHHWKGMTF
jgi:hypothetical protein